MSGFFGIHAPSRSSTLLGASIVAATHWEVSADGLYLRARDRTTFDTTPGVDITDFDARGWIGKNEAGADLAGSGLNRCFESAGDFQLWSKNSTSGSWGSTTRDAPARGKLYQHWSGRRFYFCVDVSAIPSGIGGVLLHLDGLESTTNSVTIGMGGGGTSTSVRRIRPGSAVDAAGSVNLGVAVAWFRVTLGDNVVVVDASAGATRPTTEAGWTYVATVDNLFTGSGLGSTGFRGKLFIGNVSINASSALTGFYITCKGWDDSDLAGVQWCATKKETSAQAQTLPTIDLGTGIAVWGNTQARAWAQSVTNKRPQDSATVEWRMTRGSSAVTGTGSWYAAGSIVVQGSGRYLLPEVRYTSDGTTTASVRLDVPIVPGAAF